MRTVIIFAIIGGVVLSFVVTAVLIGSSKHFRQIGRALFKYVCIPLIIGAVLLYVVGGTDLLQFGFAPLFTWGGIGRAIVVIFGIAGVTWLRHKSLYDHEPPPMWFRRSGWVNLLEALLLLAIMAGGTWAILRFTTPISK